MLTLMQAQGIETVLMAKLNDGLFDPAEWERDIKDIRESGFSAIAGALQGRYDHYVKGWSPERSPA